MTLLDRLALIAVIVIWGIHFIVAKVALEQVPAFLMITLRLAIVAVLLAPWLFKPLPPLRALFGLSLSLCVFHYGLLYLGLAGIDAGPASIASDLKVPFSVLLAAMIFGERVTPWQGAGMLSAFAGVWLISGEPRMESSIVSLLLVVAASLAWAVSGIQIRRLGPVDGRVFNAWIAVMALPPMAGLSWGLEDRQWEAVAALDWRGWSAILYSAVVVSILSWSLWYYLMAKYEVGRIVPPTLLCPVLAVFLASFLRGEPLTWEIMTGALLTVGGVALIHFSGVHARAVAKAP
jgi:O-acetylserine/cysteine efflux transporter